ncbi:putative enoyl-CoA hydratase/isomerase family protein [Aspergillus clavatus NRRL 1]|uniref:Enoyl-CoA hydratase/isomerase family protein, putative n=1 Tax=Aspergillus clavatus (strain ATCC 1007 / CBS 513.65 / DSM 816 / NCTC 3887 / NRRL 1 / QM 1276 / 107) TaxID=344612 RepID=A1CDW9_ASPCL|nr:enoyl-CoA hydratase/isomerase family protein, putative [Aspergillus clavatus NRRL 1]EAW12046.1 enoyl-CoA hydratase/isomerase family protein, putative [Aspergillus clavatus NRRL 1]
MEQTFTVECPPFDVKISHWDRILPPTHSKRILCFSLPDHTDREQLTDYLRIAFHHTVQRFPILAGSVVPFSDDQGGRPWLRNIIPSGAAHLIVKDLSDELSFADLAKANFSQHLLNTEQLCPLPEVGYFGKEQVDVCRFQANFIQGGLLLVVSIIHNAADGRGVTEIIKLFADELRKAQSGETGHPLQQRTEVYRSDRTEFVSGRGIPGAIENHAAWTSSPSNAHAQIHNVENSCHTFRLNTAALSELKRVLSSTSTGADDWFSTNDAISAFIWRSIMVARHRAGILDADATTYVAQPVDCRSKLKITETYFGNVIYMTKSSVPLSVLADPEAGIGAAARALRNELRALTGDKFRDLIGYAERTALEAHTRLNILESMATSGIILTSLFKMDLHAMDFGPAFDDGRIKALRLPARGTQAGAVIVMPRVPDGSCEFMVTEQESTIRCLQEDPLFARLTTEDPVLVEAPAEESTETVAKVNGTAHEQQPVANGVAPDQAIPSVPEPRNDEANGSLAAPPLEAATNGLADMQIIPAPTKAHLTLVVTHVPAAHTGVVKIIQLRRPEAKNAISWQMLRELSSEIEEVHRESHTNGTRALIIASAVEGIFCAGADLKERKQMTLPETRSFLASLRTVFSRLAALPIPSIACVSGRALGGGLELALCCHLRVFAADALVALPETRLAIIPGAGGTYRLPNIVGVSNALDMVLTGRLVPAKEAAAMGLCNRLVAAETAEEPQKDLVLKAGLGLAEDICNSGPLAVRAAISALTYSCEAVENAAYDSVLMTKDRTLALEAFSEKRKPILIGE